MDGIASFPSLSTVIIVLLFVPMALRMSREARTKLGVMKRVEPRRRPRHLHRPDPRHGGPGPRNAPRPRSRARRQDASARHHHPAGRSLPRLGDRVNLLIDPDHPDRVL